MVQNPYRMVREGPRTIQVHGFDLDFGFDVGFDISLDFCFDYDFEAHPQANNRITALLYECIAVMPYYHITILLYYC